jgi:hypothetical protein
MPVLPSRETQNRQLEAAFTALSCIIRHYLLRASSERLFTPLYSKAMPFQPG